MKKALGILIMLALMAVSVPMFADAPTFSGEFLWKGNWSADATTAAAVRERLNFDVKVDKNNELFVQFRGENLPTLLQTSQTVTPATATVAAYQATPIGTSLNNSLYNFKVITDIGGALALPVGLKLTAGYFDTYFTNWTYYSQSGYEFYYGWPNKLVNLGMQAGGTAQLDASFGPVNVHYAQGLDMNNTLIGADASFAGLGVYIAYGAYGYYADTSKFGKGDLSIELNYGLPEMGGFKLSVAPYFRMSLDSAAAVSSTFGASIGADYSIVHLALGYQGDNKAAAHDMVADLYFKPIDGLKAGVSAYLDGSVTNVFQGLDINAQYSFGATTVALGYVVPGTDKNAISIYGDTTAIANGLYLLVGYKF